MWLAPGLRLPRGVTATLFAASLHHRTAPVEIRERLALGPSEITTILRDVASVADVAEAMIVCTCNRVEVYGVRGPSPDSTEAVLQRVCVERGLSLGAVRPYLTLRTAQDAVLHAFRVAASLDSMIVGESQILGQMKDAFALAQGAGSVGPILYRLMTQAFTIGKRVRTETALGQHAVSVPFAAVELGRKIFGTLAGRGVLLIGAGEMGELVARHLRDQGAQRVLVANRTWAKAVAVANEVGGDAIALDAWATALGAVDVVITAAGAREPIVTRDAVRRTSRERAGRPLFFVDIAVPRAVEPGVGDLDGVFCYDVDDLAQVVDANRREREREARRAESLVLREVERFTARLREVEVVPAIVGLRERADAIRQAEVARALSRLRDASPETRQAVEALSTALVNKILHAPTARLREASVAGQGAPWAKAVRELFDLDAGTPPQAAVAPAARTPEAVTGTSPALGVT